MENIYNLVIDLISGISVFGIIVLSILIVFESIIPPLPLSLFIAIYFINYGSIIGFFASWILTIIGCIISFILNRKFFRNKTNIYLRKYNKIDKYISIVDNINLSTLTLIISLPFTPAFLVNIACGISNINFKKYLTAIIIGKIPLVLYCGFIGSSLIESIKNPIILVKVVLITLIFYYISKIINKKLKLWCEPCLVDII